MEPVALPGQPVKTIEMHTGGEPLRIVVSGLPPIAGATLLDKRRFCREQLDYGRGDDVLQLGFMDLASTRRYVQNSVPSGALFGLLVAVTFATLQRLMLPAVYWFDSSRQWGILRPREK